MPGAAITASQVVLLVRHHALQVRVGRRHLLNRQPARRVVRTSPGGGEDRAAGRLVRLPDELRGVLDRAQDRDDRLHEGGVRGEGAGIAAALLPGNDRSVGAIDPALDEDAQVLVDAGE